MKIKLITLALVVIMGAFLLPLTALAYEAVSIDGEVGYDDMPSLPILPPIQSPWADNPTTGNPFTPDGVATVVDNSTDSDGKEFFTFQTPNGNVFFLVIDRSRPNNNVYFLNAVTEQDLIALAAAPPPQTQPGINPPLLNNLNNPPVSDNGNGDTPDTPIETPTQSNSNGTMIFAVLAIIAVGGAAYYIKIVRTKKQPTDDDDDEYEDNAVDIDEADYYDDFDYESYSSDDEGE